MTTLNKTEIIEYLLDNDFSIQDNICVYCSRTMDRWNSICGNCKEYKSVMNIVDAVEYYGTDILGY